MAKKPTPTYYADRGYPTPWGPAQVRYKYTDEVSFYSCAGHGGYKVNITANRYIPAPLRNADGWYEEDCESTIVHHFLLHDFDTESYGREYFANTIRNYWPDEWTAAMGEEVTLEQSRTLRDRKFKKDNANNYVAISAYGDWADWVPEGMTGVIATLGGTRAGDVERKRFLVPAKDYTNGKFIVNTTTAKLVKENA